MRKSALAIVVSVLAFSGSGKPAMAGYDGMDVAFVAHSLDYDIDAPFEPRLIPACHINNSSPYTSTLGERHAAN
jgi:ABC-type sulfate transport system substrate-binding protein